MFKGIFGNKPAPASAPAAPASATTSAIPMAVPAGGFPTTTSETTTSPTTTSETTTSPTTGTLKDVTLRPIVLGISKDLTMVPAKTGKGKVIKTQVSATNFNKYTHVLKIMAQLARIVYCDLSVIREVVIGDKFGKEDNPAVNNQITQLDNQYSSMRRTSVDPTKNEGRPMKSYAEPACSTPQPAGTEILTYVSSPSDVTFIIISGKYLREKSGLAFFQDNDSIVIFKGSSTVKNFKHDLYSQFSATELNDLVQTAGLKLTDNPVGKVTGAFVNPLMKSWATLKREIGSKNPKRLFITGHSLGGAYASMFAFIVAECHAAQFPSIQSAHLITFGSPTLLSDTARNTFNKWIDSGFLTLDRVVSQAKTTLVIDAIPSIPAGFSHPGYQPLKTEFYPEVNTGRVYHLKTIESVFSTQSGGGKKRTKKGGLFGIGDQKNKYEKDTKLRIPTKIMIDATNPLTQGFPHAEYWGMTYLGGLRMPGMKNPAYKGNAFVGKVYPACISYTYESYSTDPSEPIAADPIDNTPMGAGISQVVSPESDEAGSTNAAPAAAPAPVAAAPLVAADSANTTPAVAATTVPAVGGRKSRKHMKGNKGNKGRRVSRRKHRKSHAKRH